MATTTNLEIDVRIETTLNGAVYSSDNRFAYETGNDFEDFLEESKQELIEQLCSFYEEEENFSELEEELQNADYEVTWEVKDWCDVSDYENLQDIDILNEIESEGIDYDFDVISAALDCDISIDDIEEAYQGEYKDDEDFAWEFAHEIGAIEKNISWPYTCIDWEHAASEIMYDYCESNGHYFRNL